jgi:ribosomal protein S18 acetylase RimI-like enzyme
MSASSSSCEFQVQLRPATDEDRDFCYSVHKAAMYENVHQLWGWIEEDQISYFDRTWRPVENQIVVVEGRDSGVLCVDHRDGEIYLGRIEVSPNLQGKGVGTYLVRALQAQAEQRKVPLVLEVLRNNERAIALYTRLGFKTTEVHGHKILLRWEVKGAKMNTSITA